MRLEVYHKRKRYWAHRVGRRVNFYSSHKWPYFHGHIDSRDSAVVSSAFQKWLPFAHHDR